MWIVASFSTGYKNHNSVLHNCVQAYRRSICALRWFMKWSCEVLLCRNEGHVFEEKGHKTFSPTSVRKVWWVGNELYILLIHFFFLNSKQKCYTFKQNVKRMYYILFGIKAFSCVCLSGIPNWEVNSYLVYPYGQYPDRLLLGFGNHAMVWM